MVGGIGLGRFGGYVNCITTRLSLDMDCINREML